MKITLNTNQITDELRKDKNANWSHGGARALAEHLEAHEESTGEVLELDVCAIRCDFSEYESLQVWAHEYFSNAWEELGCEEADCEDKEFDEAIREYINDHGTLIEFDGGIIVSTF